MEAKPIGQVIQQARKRRHLTQDALCDGLCSNVNLSRIETGKQMPSLPLAKALLERLGLPDTRYYALLPGDELKIESLMKKTQASVIQFERASDKGRASARKQALAQLRTLEDHIEPDDDITRQFILRHKATLGKEDGPYTMEEELEILREAICLTVPDFDEEEIDQGLYSMNESAVINQIAVAYALGEEHEKAIAVYRQLLSYTKANCRRLAQYAGRLALVAQNYARELCVIGDYQESIRIAELGRKAFIKYCKYQLLPGHLAIIRSEEHTSELQSQRSI